MEAGTADATRCVMSKSTWRVYVGLSSIPFWGIYIGAIVGIVMLGWSWSGLAIALASYFARMLFVTGGYHRYFSHRSFKTSRVFQFLIAVGATSSVQKGVLWWAAHHREHHRDTDGPLDPHSPNQVGFWWSHLGWFLSPDTKKTDFTKIRDFAKYPELRWINRYHLLVPVAYAAALLWLSGVHALVWGFFVSTVLLWHGTFAINSLSHVIGKQRYKTSDESRNHLGLALITLGEGWHNNHHYYQLSACHGFRWYEIDMTYYILYSLSLFGLVWDLRRPPAYIVAGVSKREFLTQRATIRKQAA